MPEAVKNSIALTVDLRCSDVALFPPFGCDFFLLSSSLALFCTSIIAVSYISVNPYLPSILIPSYSIPGDTSKPNPLSSITLREFNFLDLFCLDESVLLPLLAASIASLPALYDTLYNTLSITFLINLLAYWNE